MWDLNLRALVASFETQGVLDGVEWRKDGKALAALGLNRQLYVWDASFALGMEDPAGQRESDGPTEQTVHQED